MNIKTMPKWLQLPFRNLLSLKPGLLILTLSFSFLLILAPVIFAQETISRDEVLKKYEEVTHLTEKLHIAQEDILQTMPKLRLATTALFQNNHVQANRFLDEALQDLKLMESQGEKYAKRTFRLEWLELYWGVVQKFILLALFAFVMVRLPYFRRRFLDQKFSLISKVYLVLLLVCAAIFFAFFDVSRYGEAAWVFFDIQIVFVSVAGLLGGFWAGLIAGILVAAFRIILSPQFMIYAAIVFSAGLIAGLFSRGIETLRKTARMSLFAGGAVGLLHGLAVYLPMAGKLPLLHIGLSILFLICLEGTAVFLFMAIVSGVLDEDARLKMEKELLKTKLAYLQAQISPHFLFNALSTIAAISRKEKSFESERLVIHLAGFFRRTIRRPEDEVTLKEEMSYIDSYMELEKARYMENLNVVKDYRLADELWDVETPFLIIQPLVENAIEHGISQKIDGGTLTIKIFSEKDDIHITVIDDGPGAEESKMTEVLNGEHVTEESGIGVQNIHERLKALYGADYGLRIKTSPGAGMSVTVRIPLKK